MLDFATVQEVIGIFREEAKNMMTAILGTCNELIMNRQRPLEHNSRTAYLSYEAIRSLCVEKKIFTEDEFNGKFKALDYELSVKEKKAQEEAEEAARKPKILTVQQKNKAAVLAAVGKSRA